AAAVERKPAAREQLKAIDPPATGDEGLFLAASAAEEQLGGTAGLPGLKKDPGESYGRPGRDEAFVEIARTVDAFLCGGHGGGEAGRRFPVRWSWRCRGRRWRPRRQSG